MPTFYLVGWVGCEYDSQFSHFPLVSRKSSIGEKTKSCRISTFRTLPNRKMGRVFFISILSRQKKKKIGSIGKYLQLLSFGLFLQKLIMFTPLFVLEEDRRGLFSPPFYISKPDKFCTFYDFSYICSILFKCENFEYDT